MNPNSSNDKNRSALVRVVIVARISTVNQEQSALQAQIDLCRRHIEANVQGPFKFTVIATQGSGEIVDRAELKQLDHLIETRQIDIVIAEDIGRIMRRMHVYMLCESCDDHQVRLIAINDKIDTATGDWQLSTIFAAIKHERSNADASARISRQLNFNFLNGSCIMHLPPGIARPASGLDKDLQWDPKHARLFRVAFFLYQRKWTVVRLADWLKVHGVNLDNKKLRRLLSNPIFIGERHRGMTASHRVNRSGRRQCRRADPSNLKIRAVPQLAIISRKRFDDVQKSLKERGETYIVGRNGRPDNRKGHPRKQTVFPGQRIVCAVCGRVWYWGGHGQTRHMSCSGERQYKCWVTATFDGHDARRRICAALVTEAAKVEAFDLLLCQTIREEAVRCLVARGDRLAELRRQLGQRKREADNLVAAMLAGGGGLEFLVTAAANAQKLITDVQEQIQELERAPKPVVKLPDKDELQIQLKAAIHKVLADPARISAEFDRLVPSIVVRPVRPIDGGHVVLRATVQLDLAALITTGEDLAEQLPDLKRILTIDLFDPPERVRILSQVMQARAEAPKVTFKWIAKNLTHCTSSAVQRAFKLGEMMKKLGVTDPYMNITDPSQMTGHNKKYTRAKFKFEPLLGFPIWLKPDEGKEDRSAA